MLYFETLQNVFGGLKNLNIFQLPAILLNFQTLQKLRLFQSLTCTPAVCNIAVFSNIAKYLVASELEMRPVAYNLVVFSNIEK